MEVVIGLQLITARGSRRSGSSLTLQSIGGRLLFRLPLGGLGRRGRFPHPDRVIVAASDNPLTIQGKGDRVYRSGVALEREQFLPADELPHLSRLVVAARDNPLTVRGKGRGTDHTTMPSEA